MSYLNEKKILEKIKVVNIGIDIDEALSEESENPVQNKVVTEELNKINNNKQDNLTEKNAGNGINIENGVFSTKGWDLIYTNNNVSGGFAGQTLSLNLSKYKEVMIYCVANNTTATPNLCIISPVGNTNSLHMRIAYWDTAQSKVRQTARAVTNVSNNGITFGGGFFDGATEASLNACIPKYIYAR